MKKENLDPTGIMEKSLQEKREILNKMTSRQKADLPHDVFKQLVEEVRHAEAKEEAQRLLREARRSQRPAPA